MKVERIVVGWLVDSCTVVAVVVVTVELCIVAL